MRNLAFFGVLLVSSGVCMGAAWREQPHDDGSYSGASEASSGGYGAAAMEIDEIDVRHTDYVPDAGVEQELARFAQAAQHWHFVQQGDTQSYDVRFPVMFFEHEEEEVELAYAALQ